MLISFIDKTKIVGVIYIYLYNLRIFFKLPSLLLRCRSMIHTEYTWFRTHTTLVALFVVQIRFRVGAHLEEQFESEFGVSWSCGEQLGCFVAHTSLYLLRILLFSIQTGYPLC